MSDLPDDMFDEDISEEDDYEEENNNTEILNNDELRKYLAKFMKQPIIKNEEKEFSEENELIIIKCYFKDIKLKRHDNLFTEAERKKFNKSYNLFFCDADIKNNITGVYCEPEKICCLNCMKNNQKMYGLKPNYLINSMGRVCKYKNNKIYCKGELIRSEIKDGIDYYFNFTCRPGMQCYSCQELTKYMDKYYGEKLMNILKNRDQKRLLQ